VRIKLISRTVNLRILGFGGWAGGDVSVEVIVEAIVALEVCALASAVASISRKSSGLKSCDAMGA
jgi:hypothetical protein